MIDLGTGDGRFVLTTAARQPGTLAIGVDASAAGMVDGSRRAARPIRWGGLPNALFVVAAAEDLPHELDGLADALTVHLPWGSLLRGVLTAEPSIVAGLARVARPGASLSMLVSLEARDRSQGLPELETELIPGLAARYACHGFELLQAHPATAAEVAAAHSSWAKRLGRDRRRVLWQLRFHREGLLQARDASSGAGGARGCLTARLRGRR